MPKPPIPLLRNRPSLFLVNDPAGQPPFRRIGAGSCGSVWAVDIEACQYTTSTCAIKRADGSPDRSIVNDFKMHQKVLRALTVFVPRVRPPIVAATASWIQIPDCYGLVIWRDLDWWNCQKLERFPAQYQVPCDVLVTERIPPFHRGIRENLIERFCPEHIKQSAKMHGANRDCVVRPYLGRRGGNGPRVRRFSAFNLRNYPMNVDQMEDLHLDCDHFANTMAEALAIIHWAARIDGNDVEFVLAPPRRTFHLLHNIDATPAQATRTSATLGEHILWILDFDLCRDMTMDEAGVEQAWRAFYRNDPYYPHPCKDNSEDQRLWQVFRKRFLEASAVILNMGEDDATELMGLPEMLMSRIEQGKP